MRWAQSQRTGLLLVPLVQRGDGLPQVRARRQHSGRHALAASRPEAGDNLREGSEVFRGMRDRHRERGGLLAGLRLDQARAELEHGRRPVRAPDRHQRAPLVAAQRRQSAPGHLRAGA